MTRALLFCFSFFLTTAVFFLPHRVIVAQHPSAQTDSSNRESNREATIRRLEKAIRELEGSSDRSDASATILENEARLYALRDEPAAAASTYAQALKASGSSRKRNRLEEKLLDFFEDSGRLKAIASHAADAGTATFAMQHRVGDHYFSENNFAKAVRAYEAALEFPVRGWPQTDVTEHLVESYCRLGRITPALRLTEEFIINPGQQTRYLLNMPHGPRASTPVDWVEDRLIRAAFEEGELDKVIREAEWHQEDSSNPIAPLAVLGKAYERNEEPLKPARSYESLTTLQPHALENYYAAAAAYQKARRSEDVRRMIEAGRKVLTQVKADTDAWTVATMGSYAHEAEAYDEAKALLNMALSLPNRPSRQILRFQKGVNKALAEAHLATEDYARAIESCHEWLARTQDSAEEHDARMMLRHAGRGVIDCEAGRRRERSDFLPLHLGMGLSCQ